ncbi:hypothetical protein IFM89_021536 [Coptis chinensis]|uniref:Uncharacterized protein n=1 Tax=Coptis chinensis TaxID=261450 RepID=A0A835HG35_9MAGN|nr:hypothetical protein IFM89_021536 [Coptis chinensis]
MNMDYEGQRGSGFGTHYYKSLVEGKGILHVDRPVDSREATIRRVQTYSSYGPLCSARTLLKLLSLRVLTSSLGQIRLNCYMVSSKGL